jgi:putative aldouronate transport system permease protein
MGPDRNLVIDMTILAPRSIVRPAPAARPRRPKKVRDGLGLDVAIYAALAVVTLGCLIPLYYVVVISVTPQEIWSRTNGSLLVPLDELTIRAYRELLGNGRLTRAMGVSVFITVVGTFLSLTFTTLLAYPLAQRRFRLRRPILLMVLFTMLFGGGLIPTYLTVKNLHLLDSYWALILPNLISAFNLLVMKAFFQNLPPEIEEAARIDGASEWQILGKIVLPLSRPILATIGLFYAVAYWNSFFDAILYISDDNRQVLQVVLRSILAGGQLSDYVDAAGGSDVPQQSLQMAAVVITTIPVLLVYPFLQRHFTAGVLLGSVKD